LIALLVTMGLSKDWNQSWIVGVPWLILVTIAYFIWKQASRAQPNRVRGATHFE
jgi:amino acid transporter, AAT family